MQMVSSVIVSKLRATIHIYCHIRCNLKALMAATHLKLIDIGSFLMHRVHDKKNCIGVEASDQLKINSRIP